MGKEKYEYLKTSMTVEELIEEMNLLTKELNNSAFTSTFDIQQGMKT